jgi:hypothetical protein
MQVIDSLFEKTCQFIRHSFNNRSNHAARPAPGGPEVQQDDLAAVVGHLLE